MPMTITSSPIKKLNFYANWFRPQTTLNLLTFFLLSPVYKAIALLFCEWDWTWKRVTSRSQCIDLRTPVETNRRSWRSYSACLLFHERFSSVISSCIAAAAAAPWWTMAIASRAGAEQPPSTRRRQQTSVWGKSVRWRWRRRPGSKPLRDNGRRPSLPEIISTSLKELQGPSHSELREGHNCRGSFLTFPHQIEVLGLKLLWG